MPGLPEEAVKDDQIRAFDRLVYAARRRLEEKDSQATPWGFTCEHEPGWARGERHNERSNP